MIQDYITNKIDNKISILKGLGDLEKSKIHYQAKFEYFLIHMMSYLWNKNIDKVDVGNKQYVINTIMKPSIGSIISTARTLDIENEVFGNRKMKTFYQAIDEYPKLRNQRIGHGYLYEDATEEYIGIFEDLFSKFETDKKSYFNEKFDIIQVLQFDNGIYSGVKYSHSLETAFWSCPKEVSSFKVNDVYTFSDNYGYQRISPYISIDNDNFYVFCSVEEKLTGRVKYNQLLKTGQFSKDIKEFSSFTAYSDSLKKRTTNDTIITIYEPNFKKYIEVGITDQIKKFVTKNKSSVFGTIWGHGGVGKTSAVQNFCERLGRSEVKRFDYIIFLSAKDRFYNYYKGKIEELNTAISSLEDIINLTNKVMFDDESFEINKILDYQGKVLFIIDDFESFVKVEKEKIIDFIKKLNINHHKVIITTRSATLITGEEIQANELDEEQTKIFFIQALENEVPGFQIKKREINKHINKIWQITSGRPLFILQFAILLGQKGTFQGIIEIDISNQEEARKFLYDRIYDYLSIKGKNMFLAIGLLANKEDLTGVISRLRFLMGLEGDTNDEEFEAIFSELTKLKLVLRENNDLFKVYSKDVLSMMDFHYDNKGIEFNPDISNRYKLISDSKAKDLDYAMLEVADSKRITSPEGEVTGLYRRIINREQTSNEVRIKAFVNYSQYLFSFKENTEKTLKLCKDYRNKFDFKNNGIFNYLYAKYLWVEGSYRNRQKSIKILRAYLSKSPNISTSRYLEIISSLMTYSSAMIIDEREQIKNAFRVNEINKGKFNFLYRKQKEKFVELYKYPGRRIVELISDVSFRSFSGGIRDHILDALVYYCEVCTRIKKYDDAIFIINKVFKELPPDYHKPFEVKFEMIDKIKNPANYDKFGRKKPVSEFGKKLLDAIKESEEE